MTQPLMDRYALVLLVRGDNPPRLSDEESDELQARHLAHNEAMRRAGKLLVAGPFTDQFDESWRGMCIYGTSVEEARMLTEQDPAVKAGRLKAQVLTWKTLKGAIRFP